MLYNNLNVVHVFSLEVVRRPKPKRSKISAQNPVKMLTMRTDIQQTYREQLAVLSPQTVKQCKYVLSYLSYRCWECCSG